MNRESVIADPVLLRQRQEEYDREQETALQEAMEGWWAEDLKNREGRIRWWKEAKFGCFIHWGVYSIYGGMWKGRKCGYGEHIQRAMTITQREYREAFIDRFFAEQFCAEEWVKLAKDAGMRYLVVTAKHHDGLAMYPSRVSSYNITLTPFGKHHDPIGELAEACRREGLFFGVYYSHAFDWGEADGPGNDWEYENGGGDRRLYEGERGLWFAQHPELIPRVKEGYVNQKSIPQILELIERYRPDLLWFDTPHKLPLSENLRILREIRRADPHVVVNGRLATNPAFPTLGDYRNTADRPKEFYPAAEDWEAIPTTNESYGYSCFDKSHKSADFFIRLLVKAAARGGNLLMNMGPKGDGTVDLPDQSIFRTIGEWMKENGESIYGTERTPLTVQTFGETTKKGNRLYLHVLRREKGKPVILSGLLNSVRNARFLDSRLAENKIRVRRLNYRDTLFDLPEEADGWPYTDLVICAEVDGGWKTEKSRLVEGEEPTFLHAFDATFLSNTLTFGDGKEGNDYVDGFVSSGQTVIWQIRMNKPGRFFLKIRYARDPKNSRLGENETFVVQAGNKTGEFLMVPRSGIMEEQMDVELGLHPGKAEEIRFHMGEAAIGGVRLYGVELIPFGENDGGTERKSGSRIAKEEDVTDTGMRYV